MSDHFEAKKIAWRQTKEGLVVAFAVHPDEMPKELATAPLNTRYMIAFAEIGDDEKPVVRPAPQAKAKPEAAPPKPFSELPLSQQAALRCGDALFQEFIKVENEPDATDYVRLYCGVGSRSNIKTETPAGERWEQLETKFQGFLTDRKFAEAKR